MMTPQEVSEHAFAKASFGGYNMAMVDEFLDQLTADYSALYKENTSLKAKMKVLADSLDEYRATEKGMRRALLAAQQTADEMVKEAEQRKSELLRNAEADIQQRISDLRRQVADEEARLSAAQTATAAFVEKIRAACLTQEEFLDSLSTIAAPTAPISEDTVEQTAQDIEESVQKIIEWEDVKEEAPKKEADEIPADPVIRHKESVVRYEEPASRHEDPAVRQDDTVIRPKEPVGRSRRDLERARAFEEADPEEEADFSPTRRIDFDNLQFGANYDLK